MRDQNGKMKHESDDDWPLVIVQFSGRERVIYTDDYRNLIVQIRRRSLRNDNWSKWQFFWKTASHEEMRKLQEKAYPFDFEKLDAICLKTDDGDYVEHSH